MRRFLCVKTLVFQCAREKTERKEAFFASRGGLPNRHKHPLQDSGKKTRALFDGWNNIVTADWRSIGTHTEGGRFNFCVQKRKQGGAVQCHVCPNVEKNVAPFTFMSSTGQHGKPGPYILSLTLFHSWEKWGLEKSSDLNIITQLSDKDWDCSSATECLLSMCRALGSSPSTWQAREPDVDTNTVACFWLCHVVNIFKPSRLWLID